MLNYTTLESLTATLSSLQANSHQPFTFKRRTVRVNWSLLLSANLEHITKTVDINNLQQYIDNLTYCDITVSDLIQHNDDVKHNTDVQLPLLHVFRLSQLCIEYLLYIQSYMIAEQHSANKLVEQLTDKLLLLRDTCNKKIKTKNSTIKQLQAEIRTYKETHRIYENNIRLMGMYENNHGNIDHTLLTQNQLNDLQSKLLNTVQQSNNSVAVQSQLQVLQQYIQQQFEAMNTAQTQNKQHEITITSQQHRVQQLEQQLAQQQQSYNDIIEKNTQSNQNKLTEQQAASDKYIAELKHQIAERDSMIDQLMHSSSAQLDAVKQSTAEQLKQEHAAELQRALAALQAEHDDRHSKLIAEHTDALSALQQQHAALLAQQAADAAATLQSRQNTSVPTATAQVQPTTDTKLSAKIQLLRDILQARASKPYSHPQYEYLHSRYKYTADERSNAELLLHNEIAQCNATELNSMYQYIDNNKMQDLHTEKYNELEYYTRMYYQSNADRVISGSRSPVQSTVTDIPTSTLSPVSAQPVPFKPKVVDTASSPINDTVTDSIHTRTLSKPLPVVKQLAITQATNTDTATQMETGAQASVPIPLGNTFIEHISDDFTPANKIETVVTDDNPLHPQPIDEYNDEEEFNLAVDRIGSSHHTVTAVNLPITIDTDIPTQPTTIVLSPMSPTPVQHPVILSPTSQPIEKPTFGNTQEIQILCELCDEAPSSVYCTECGMNLCTAKNCDTELHAPNNMKSHIRTNLDVINKAHGIKSQISKTVDDELPDMTTPVSNVATQRNALLALNFTPRSYEKHMQLLEQPQQSKKALPTVLPAVQKPKPIASRRPHSNLPVFLQTQTLTG